MGSDALRIREEIAASRNGFVIWQMYPAPFEYLAPKDLDEAVELLGRYGNDAKLLAGGQSLVPMMKLRIARPKYLIDIHRLTHLNYIREEAREIRCGAMTRHIQIETSALLRDRLPLLCKAAGKIGDVQVRNRGTLGGALAEADPAGDYGPIILALNAQLKCVGPKGERIIRATDFFRFAYTTAVEPDEILTEVIFPVPSKSSSAVYVKLEHVSGDFAIAAAAVQLGCDQNGLCTAIGIGVIGAGAVPTKATTVEKLLHGNRITPQIIADAGRVILEGAEPIADSRGSASYKKRALSAVLCRALAEASGANPPPGIAQ